MPVLESTDDKIAPKSILRHRPIDDVVSTNRKYTSTKVITIPVAQRASRSNALEDTVTEGKHSTKVTDVQKAPSRQQARPTTSTTTSQHFSQSSLHLSKHHIRKHRIELRAHSLLYLGLGMVLMLTFWMLLTAVFGWFTMSLDDIRYGRPRTYQTDAWVGHNEQTDSPSHFIAVNLRKHIEIIEIAGGDPAHTRIYSGPELYGNDDDLTPVTLSFIDVNGDHKPDMLISFRGTRIIYINDQGGFRPLLPAERPQVEQFLQHLGQ